MFLYSLIDEREISKNLYAVGLRDRLINIQLSTDFTGAIATLLELFGVTNITVNVQGDRLMSSRDKS